MIPLSYYLSYILAAVAQDYRFMYPSTLAMQVIGISLLLAKTLKYLLDTIKNRQPDNNFSASRSGTHP
jgi:hypothetical protein